MFWDRQTVDMRFSASRWIGPRWIQQPAFKVANSVRQSANFAENTCFKAFSVLKQEGPNYTGFI